MTARSPQAALPLLLAGLLVLAGPARADGATAGQRRVLAVHSFEATRPADVDFSRGLRTGLPLGVETLLYSEHLDRRRFPGPAYEEGFRAWIRTKYASTPPDVIVAVGEDAYRFLEDPARTPFPGVPVVLGLVPEEVVSASPPPPGFAGVMEHIAVRETLALALRLFPETRHVALVGGASEQDRSLNALLRAGAAEAGPGVEIQELFGLPMDALQTRLRALPERTVVLVMAMLEDGAGREWTVAQLVTALAADSTGPIFTVFDVVGRGTVGGVVSDLEASGRETAAVVLELLEGAKPDTLGFRRAGNSRVVLDARQLERWGVPEARVPAGAELRFEEATPWSRLRVPIVLALTAIAAQAALIGLLLLERRRRAVAEAQARESLAEVAHMNRVSTLGELVGSLAHEINSPLGAVLANAEAAQRILTAGDEARAEVRACLEDIVLDVTRAGEVLKRIRGALKNERWTPVRLELDRVIRDCVKIVNANAEDRGIEVEVQITPPLPAVMGDEVQLVQVIVNLLLNAFEAVAGQPEDRRRVRLAAEPHEGGVAIRVVDSGPGVPPELATRVFEPFFTTKRSGLGMGLSVTRSIVSAHGGSISVSRGRDGGAVFEVLLPGEPPAASARPAE